MIEKHFTLDRTMEGPDHAASVEPEALKGLVFGIRQVEQALGNGVKRPSMAELRNRPIVRRSVVASCDLPESHVLTISDMAIKRPGYGISPVDMWDCVGRRLETSVALDQPIKKEDLV